MRTATLSTSGRDASWAERSATTAVFLANGLGIGAWAAAIPVFKAQLALSDGALGLALLAFAVGAVLAMPVAGFLAPRFGTGAATRVFALLFAVTVALPPFAPSLATLAVAAFALGAANGALDVAMNAHAGGVERRWGLPIMSSFHAAFSAGGLAGATLGGLLASAGGLWMMGTASAVGVALALFAWPTLREDAVPGDGAAPHLMLPGWSALSLCVVALASMLSEGAVADWSAVYLRGVTNAPAGLAAAGYAAFSATMVAGRILGDRTVRALGRATVVRSGGLIASVGLALALLWPDPAVAIAGFALVGLGLSNVVPSVFSAAGLIGSSAAAGVAMAATAGYVGHVSGPVAIGGLAQVAGLRTAMVLLLVCVLAIAALAGAVQPRPSRPS